MSLDADIVLRAAGPGDLDALNALEQTAFPGDRLDRRAFWHALGSATIDMAVAESGCRLVGYVAVQRRRGSTLARLTSVAASHEGLGIGRRLVAEAERLARLAGCRRMRLEVRADNARGRALYERGGYRLVTTLDGYYDDGCPAQRFEKALGDRQDRP